MLLDGTGEIDGGTLRAPVKLNLGDAGYYRVQYDAANLAALAAFDRPHGACRPGQSPLR